MTSLFDVAESIGELSSEEIKILKAECAELASRYLMVCDISAFWKRLSERLTDTAAGDIDFSEYERDHLQIILVSCSDQMQKHENDTLWDFWHNLHWTISTTLDCISGERSF